MDIKKRIEELKKEQEVISERRVEIQGQATQLNQEDQKLVTDFVGNLKAIEELEKLSK